VFVAIERSIKTYEPQDFKLSEAIREKTTTEVEIYRSRKEDKADVFNYIELFYNPTRRHRNNNDLSPMEYEKNYYHANHFKILLLLLCYLF
jgi:transposase InsO family protein